MSGGYRNNNNRFKNNNNNNNNEPRPNYFFGLQLTDMLIYNQLTQVQQQLKAKERYINIQTAEKFHLTVFVMTLTDVATQLPLLQSLLPQAKQIANELFGENINPSVNLKGIGCFNNRVVWAGLEEGEQLDKLSAFHSRLIKLIQDNNIKAEDRWSPHITLARGKQDEIVRALNIIKPYEQTVFGNQKFESLQLMQIGSTDKNNNNYYQIIDQIKFA